MPTYEYMCDKCEHEFEREQRMSDPPVKTCPKCRSRRVKKLISKTSFVLKGGGWYSDLYASPKKDKGGTDGDSSSPSESGSDSKSESSSDKSNDTKSDKKKTKSSESKSSASASKKGKNAA